MSCAHGKTKSVRSHDCGHCGNLGRGTLSVSQMVLSNLLSDRNDNTLPSDHGPKAQGQGDRDFYPRGYEFGSEVDVLLVVGKNSPFVRIELRFPRLLHDPQSFADKIHVIAEVPRSICRDVAEQPEFLNLAADRANRLP